VRVFFVHELVAKLVVIDIATIVLIVNVDQCCDCLLTDLQVGHHEDAKELKLGSRRFELRSCKILQVEQTLK